MWTNGAWTLVDAPPGPQGPTGDPGLGRGLAKQLPSATRFGLSRNEQLLVHKEMHDLNGCPFAVGVGLLCHLQDQFVCTRRQVAVEHHGAGKVSAHAPIPPGAAGLESAAIDAVFEVSRIRPGDTPEANAGAEPSSTTASDVKVKTETITPNSEPSASLRPGSPP